MKKLIPNLVLLFICNAVFSQDIPSYFGNDPEWRVGRTLSEFASGSGCFENEEIVYYVHHDTVINDVDYHTIYRRGQISEWQFEPGDPNACNGDYIIDEWVAFMRQEDRKIWLYDSFDEEDDLLYDFDIQVGDTLDGMIASSLAPNTTVTSIDSVLLNGSYLRIINYSSMGATDFFLEGVGHNFGFIEPAGISLDFSSVMYCYRQEEEHYYYFEGGPSICFFAVSVDELDNSKLNVVLFPNPVEEEINLSIDSKVKLEAIKVYSTQGQLVKIDNNFYQNQVLLNVSELESGYYFLHLRSESGATVTKPFVKK